MRCLGFSEDIEIKAGAIIVVRELARDSVLVSPALCLNGRLPSSIDDRWRAALTRTSTILARRLCVHYDEITTLG